MTPVDFIRLLRRHIKLLISVPLVMAATVFWITHGQPRQYASTTVIYTGLVSGYTIESGQGSRLDFHVVNSGFDNLIHTIRAHETLADVALQMIALHLVEHLNTQQDVQEMMEPIAQHMRHAFPNSLTATQRFEHVVERLRDTARDTESPVYELLYRAQTPFSIDEIARHLAVTRIGASDLIQLRYTAPDPVLCQKTLETISAIFMSRFKAIKQQEAGSVVDYFIRETTASHERLQATVERLRIFSTENRVINYYEQTKSIASQKELIDQQIQQEEMSIAAAESALAEVDEKIGLTQAILDKNNSILAQRQRLAELTTQTVLHEAEGTLAPALHTEIEQVEQDMAASVRDLYQISHSKEGVAKEDLVAGWLTYLMEVTERRASLGVLKQRRAQYHRVYDEFAPLGATLSSLEREIDIAEREYLDLLHSLNLAKMRQQNIEMAANLQILDAPTFPEHPLPSKAKLLVVVAFLAGLMLCMGGLLAVEFLDRARLTLERGDLDRTPLTPERGEMLTEL